MSSRDGSHGSFRSLVSVEKYLPWPSTARRFGVPRRPREARRTTPSPPSSRTGGSSWSRRVWTRKPTRSPNSALFSLRWISGVRSKPPMSSLPRPKRPAFSRKHKEADYVFTVKKNQPILHEDIESLPWEAFPPRQTFSTLIKATAESSAAVSPSNSN